MWFFSRGWLPLMNYFAGVECIVPVRWEFVEEQNICKQCLWENKYFVGGCMHWHWVHSACQMRACWGAPGLGMAEKGKESQWTLNFGQISKYTSTQWTLCTPFQFKVSLRNSRGWKTNSSLHSAHLVVIMAWFFQHSSDFQRPPSTAKKMLQKSFKNSPMS